MQLMLTAGCKAELMVRMHHFGLRRPRSTPVQIVAHRQQQGRLIVTRLLRAAELPQPSSVDSSKYNPCNQLCQQIDIAIDDYLRHLLLYSERFSYCDPNKSWMQELARVFIPHLHAGFKDVGLFHRVAM